MAALLRYLLCAVFSLTATVVRGGVALHVVSDHRLAGSAEGARDVRWASASSVYVTTAAGVLQVDTETGQVKGSSVLPPGKTGKCETCSRLGVSADVIATAFPAFAIGWKRAGTDGVQTLSFDATVDLDVFKDRLLLLGSRRENGVWAPDGAIGWVGTFSRGLSDLHPVLYSTLGPKAKIIGQCGFLEGGGAVRFFPDGSFVIAPGVEPGVYLYGTDEKLLYTWQTAGLGLMERCDVPDEQRTLYARDPEARMRWRNRYRTIEDILLVDDCPALLVRQFSDGKTSWTMIVLKRSGPPETVTLPFSAASDVAFLKADARGERMAFLVVTYGQWRTGAAPVPARLVVVGRK